jgi:tetratricopeptide (TPR) repeat protein
MPVANALAAVAVVGLIDLLRSASHRVRGLVLAAALGALWLGSHQLYQGPDAPLAVVETTVAEERHRGMDLFREGRYLEAIDVYRAILATGDDAATHSNLANALQKLGRTDEAIGEYRRALSFDPRDAITWYDLGNLLRLQRDDYRGAADAYRRALDAAPLFPEAHFNLGSVLLDQGERTAAAREFETALRNATPIAPWRAEAERLLAEARRAAAPP